jgi:hypothetical protein
LVSINKSLLLIGVALVCVAAAPMLQGQSVTSDEIKIASQPYVPEANGTIKVQSAIVDLTVVVRDANGKLVTGLKKEDFEILDQGKKQTVSGFNVELAHPPATRVPEHVETQALPPAPPANAALFEVVVTARAYDGALAIARQARQRSTSVQAGPSILDSNYHPASVSLDSWQKSNPKSAPSLSYWQGEDVNPATPVMHLEMTKRAYEQMLALVAGSDLRVRPSRTSDQNN